jgi:hypothetical protein
MARDSAPRPFNQRSDIGPNGYRTEHDPIDERPLLCWRRFWADDAEREAYERAAESISPCRLWIGSKPRPADGETAEQRQARERHEAATTYLGMARVCQEIATVAAGLRLSPRLKAMPHAPGNRAWEERRWGLKRDALRDEAKRVSGGLRMDHDEVGE